MPNKRVRDFERERNLVLLGDVKADQVVTAEQFAELLKTHEFRGVSFADREKFLTDNGYAINRENLINPDLSVKNKEDE